MNYSKLEEFAKLEPLEQWKGFIDWMGEQPVDETFDYTNNYNCPKAQFLKSLLPSDMWKNVSVGESANIREYNNGTHGKIIVKILDLEEENDRDMIYSLERCLINKKTFGATHKRLVETLNGLNIVAAYKK